MSSFFSKSVSVSTAPVASAVLIIIGAEVLLPLLLLLPLLTFESPDASTVTKASVFTESLLPEPLLPVSEIIQLSNYYFLLEEKGKLNCLKNLL